MNNKKDELKIVYDQEADVLYVMRGQPEYTDYVEYADDLILRFHPETKQLVGFTLVDFHNISLIKNRPSRCPSELISTCTVNLLIETKTND